MPFVPLSWHAGYGGEGGFDSRRAGYGVVRWEYVIYRYSHTRTVM